MLCCLFRGLQGAGRFAGGLKLKISTAVEMNHLRSLISTGGTVQLAGQDAIGNRPNESSRKYRAVQE